MGTPDSVNLGRNGKYGNININGLKGGVKQSDIKDAQQIKLFNKFDTNKNGILEADEIEALQKSLGNYAKDGKITKREAKKFIKENGLKGEVKKGESFEFLEQLGALSENINKTTESELNGLKTLNIEYNKAEDGTVLTEIYNQASGGLCAKKTEKGDTTVTQYYTEDGKINKETTEQDCTTTTVLYDETGKITSKTRQKGTYTEYLDENDRVTRKETDKGQGAKEIKEYEYDEAGGCTATTTSPDGSTTITKQDGTSITTQTDGTEVIEKDGVITTFSADGYTQTVKDINSNTSTKIVYNPDSRVETQTYTDAEGVERVTVSKDGKHVSETVTKDGQSYKVEYDGNGNTYIIVQNAETSVSIAKKFGISTNELFSLNKPYRDELGNRYFLAGQKIKVPGELGADDTRLTGRKDAQGAASDYAASGGVREAAANAEAKERKNLTWTEQNFNTFEEIARNLFKQEGNENPGNLELSIRIKQLKKQNPSLEDGKLKGEKITAGVSEALHEDRVQSHYARVEAVAQKKVEAEHKAGKSMASSMYSAIHNHMGGVSEKEFKIALDKVNSDNVVGLLKEYNEMSPDETLIEAIMDETGNRLSTRKKAVETIVNALIKRAENAKVSDERQRQAIEACKEELNSYWTLGIGYCQTSKLDGLINNLIGTIDAAEAGSGTKGNGIDETLGLMGSQLSENTEALERQLAQDGWCADLYEGLKWCVGSDNLDENVKADLKKYEGYIGELQKAEQTGGEAAFKAKFKEIFGVEYDAKLVKGYNKLQYNFAMAQGLTMQKEGFYAEFGSCINGQETYTSMRNKYSQYLAQIAQTEGQEINADSAVDTVISAQLKKQGLDINTATDAQKQQALKTVISNTYNAMDKELNKYTHGQSLANMEKQLKNAGSGVFGNKNDIAFRVNDYISSQQQGGAAVNMTVKIAGSIAIGVATGGTGWAALALTAGATAAISASVDLTDRVSSEVGLQDGEILDILKNAFIDGATVGAGLKLSKFVAMFKNANAFVQYGGKLIGQVGGDIAIGATAEYCKTGEITFEGVVFQATFSAAGNLVALKQIGKAQTHTTEPHGSQPKVLDKATSNNNKTPGGKLGEAKFRQAKAEVTEELNAGVSSERAAELFNEGNLLQSQNRVQGREIKQIVEDNVGVYDSHGLGKIDLAKETDLSRLKQCRNEIQQWQNSTRDKEALVKKIDARISELEAAPNIQGQQVNSEILDAMNNYTEKDAAAILAAERQPLAPHDAAILNDEIKLLNTVEDLNAMKEKLQSRVGYQVQGVDHAKETIREIESKISRIRAHEADFKAVTSRIDDTVSAKKGLSSDDLATIRAYAEKCNSAEELQKIVTKMKATKSFGGSKKLISDINKKIEILNAKAETPREVLKTPKTDPGPNVVEHQPVEPLPDFAINKHVVNKYSTDDKVFIKPENYSEMTPDELVAEYSRLKEYEATGEMSYPETDPSNEICMLGQNSHDMSNNKSAIEQALEQKGFELKSTDGKYRYQKKTIEAIENPIEAEVVRPKTEGERIEELKSKDFTTMTDKELQAAYKELYEDQAEHKQMLIEGELKYSHDNSAALSKIENILKERGLTPEGKPINRPVNSSGEPEVVVKHEGNAAAVSADEVEVVAVVANDAVELTPVTPIEQSQNFNRTHKISTDEVVMDGYRDGGRRLKFNDDGSLANEPSREIILVDRNKDTKLQAIISDVKKKTANMTDKEKAAFLQEYIYNISGGDKFNMEIHDAWDKLHTGKEVLLGDIINEAPPVAVCRHRSLLYKILGDEVDLKVELQRGNFYRNNETGGGHAWNTVQFDDGTSAIYDAMHNRTSSITPGNVDDYAKYYFRIGDKEKPLYNNGLHQQNVKVGRNNLENIPAYRDFSNQKAGTILPAGEGVLLNGTETLELGLGHYELDLSAPEISAKLKAMKDGDVITVGREVNGANDIKINNTTMTVSREHLTIEKSGDKYIVTDKSLNGTKIAKNGGKSGKPEVVAVVASKDAVVPPPYVKTDSEIRAMFANKDLNIYDTFDQIYRDNYKEIRLSGEYSMEESVNGDFNSIIRRSELSENGIIVQDDGIVIMKKRNWIWHQNNKTGAVKAVNKAQEVGQVDRVSLSVKADKQMLAELDQLFLKGEYKDASGNIVKIPNKEFTKGVYKTDSTLETEDGYGWLHRHDPITCYFAGKVSDEMLNAIASITDKYKRIPQRQLLGAVEGKPWIAHEPYITVDQINGLMKDAEKLNNPQLLAVIKDAGDNMSTGQFEAYRQMVEDYKRYMTLP